MNIFCTGQIQVGKSTIINKFIDAHPNLKIGGFRTISNFDENLGVNGGVYIFPAYQKELVFNEENQVGNRISGQMAFPEVFDLKGVEILNNSNNNGFNSSNSNSNNYSISNDDFDLILMDEIGFMETKAKEFSKKVISLLDDEIPVIGVVKPRNDGLPLEVRTHRDTKVLTITKENREDMYIEFTRLLEEELGI